MMKLATLTTAAILLCACNPQPLPYLPQPDPLPLLPMEQSTPPPPPVEQTQLFPAVPEMNFADEGLPITLSSADVDIRALLPIIAEAAGLSIVIGPEVEGEITVQLDEVPALVALRTILDEMGLTLIGPTVPRLWGPVVYYMLPTNIETASVEVIQARFGVSREVAEMAVGRRGE